MELNPSALACSFPSYSEVYGLVRREACRHGGAVPGFGKHEVSAVGFGDGAAGGKAQAGAGTV